MQTLAIMSLVVAISSVIFGLWRFLQSWKSISYSPVTVKRREGGKAVTLPPHYDAHAVRALHELLA